MDPRQAQLHTHMPRKINPWLQAIRDYSKSVAERNRQQTRPADPYGPLSQFTGLANYLHQGAKDIANVDAAVSDFRKMGRVSPLNALLMALGPLAGVQGRVSATGLKLLPIEKLTGSSIAGDALSEILKLTGGAIKKVAAPTAGAFAALPTEAEGQYARVLSHYIPSFTKIMRGEIDSVRSSLNKAEQQIFKLLDEGVPTKLRHVDHKQGQRMPDALSKEEKRFFRGLDELFPRGRDRPSNLIHPNYREHLINLFNRGYKVDDIFDVARMHDAGRRAHRMLRKGGKKPPDPQYDLFEPSPPVTPKGSFYSSDILPASSRRRLSKFKWSFPHD